VVSGALALLAALFAIFYSGFDPVVIGLVVYGSLMLLLYTYPLKYFALGELTIFLIWGPIIIGGVFFVLTRQWSWNVVLAGIPFGLSTASINIGKHIDKSGEDRQKGVGTLPVRIGETAARYLNIAAIILAYAITVYLIAVPRFLTPVALIVFFAAPLGWKAIVRMSQPRPEQAPPGYPVWPRWFSTVAFMHNRWFGNLFILAVLLDTVIRLIFPGFWR
jgi:1,4-dihydroxy-2-naphthoate polyprenyltransferase